MVAKFECSIELFKKNALFDLLAMWKHNYPKKIFSARECQDVLDSKRRGVIKYSDTHYKLEVLVKRKILKKARTHRYKFVW